MNLIIEAIIVGILILVVGTCVSYLIRLCIKSTLPQVCKDWNKNHVMEICLFSTGFIAHLLCELTGINKWYCTNGNVLKNYLYENI